MVFIMIKLGKAKLKHCGLFKMCCSSVRIINSLYYTCILYYYLMELNAKVSHYIELDKLV